MVGESGTSSSKGQVYHYYRCVNSKRKKTCKAKHRSVRKDPLVRAVVASVMQNIMDDAFVEYFTDQALALQGQESNELPALCRIQAGIFNASTKRRLDELEATKKKLELSIIKEEMKKPQFTREQIQFYILLFRKVDTNTSEGRRRLIDGFVNSVVVYDDYILVGDLVPLAAGVFGEGLYLFPCGTVNDGLVDIEEASLVFLRFFNAAFDLIGLGVTFEVDCIAAVFLQGEDFLDGGVSLFGGLHGAFAAGTVNAPAPPVIDGVDDPIRSKGGGGLRVNYLKTRVVRVFNVPIRRRGERNPGVTFHLVDDPALLRNVLGVVWH